MTRKITLAPCKPAALVHITLLVECNILLRLIRPCRKPSCQVRSPQLLLQCRSPARVSACFSWNTPLRQHAMPAFSIAVQNSQPASLCLLGVILCNAHRCYSLCLQQARRNLAVKQPPWYSMPTCRSWRSNCYPYSAVKWRSCSTR